MGFMATEGDRPFLALVPGMDASKSQDYPSGNVMTLCQGLDPCRLDRLLWALVSRCKATVWSHRKGWRIPFPGEHSETLS